MSKAIKEGFDRQRLHVEEAIGSIGVKLVSRGIGAGSQTDGDKLIEVSPMIMHNPFEDDPLEQFKVLLTMVNAYICARNKMKRKYTGVEGTAQVGEAAELILGWIKETNEFTDEEQKSILDAAIKVLDVHIL